MDFGELTINGLIDTGALSSANPGMDFRNIRLLSPQSINRQGPPPNFQILVANGQLETPKSTIELKFEVGDIEFHEIFIVLESLTGPTIVPLKTPNSSAHEARHSSLSIFLHAPQKVDH